MHKNPFLKIFTSGIKVAKQTSKNLKSKSSEYIKDNILNNEFVTRKEFEKLRKLVIKLSTELDDIKKK